MLQEETLNLLRQLIATPSFSREESDTADLLINHLETHGVAVERWQNNLWAKSDHFDPQRPTLLLNSHHDTVKPNAAYQRDPFAPDLVDDRLYGLGSNDAGGALVTLLQTFLTFRKRSDLSYNLVFAASAEEEIGGPNGMAGLFDRLPKIDAALVGEPTQMRAAVAERGLLVVDGYVRGGGGHAAHPGTDNALMRALPELQKLHGYDFERVSPALGKVRVSVTGVETNLQHNVVPAECHFVLDVRTTECYSNEATLEILRAATTAELRARSFRNRASGLDPQHPLYRTARRLELETYASPTLSDQVFLPVPSLKMGPGRSRRSHQPDEYITLPELGAGVRGYHQFLEQLDLYV